MSQITVEDVEYIAGLAQLEVDAATKARLTEELGKILGYVAKLNELDTRDVPPMMHALEMRNVFREDEAGPSLPRDLALRAAPSHDGQYFIVPRILDTDEV
ncbi:MAG TPA: Asp-tRNA(Asn)/Glu-tRNA(Gln) amidotransferase subunit GatC [Candidatus Hydrogenedentes bacterium]|nr:Asp-tRNA(Asn)/Glu-tRNA(Gln) amidotransferase subunit GatC [Candidatus Hydrogenedentota bacterium]HNT89546.1 Asp-tRNA(Asn)/Glu-tRNA(Gln) amidotransferase subunit GatC [Candidatus Hydrogenedentota bacterium]